MTSPRRSFRLSGGSSWTGCLKAGSPVYLLAAILLLSGCASNVVPVMSKPSEALMVDCPAPQLIPDADKQTADDINIERAEVAKYAVCQRGKFHSLRDWVRGMAK